jgi:hypothetical protein
MNDRRFNWPLWLGFALAVIGVLSYPLFFYRFPITRDVPWVTFILLAVGLGMIVAGVRRAPGRKIAAIIVAILGFALAVMFTVGVTVGSRVPTGTRIPAVGAKAPDFTLPDSNGKPLALAQLLRAPGSKGVLLVFYRGYW